MRYLIRVSLLLVCIAVGTAWWLLYKEGKSFNWRNVAQLPEVHLPRLGMPDWQDLQFWKEKDPGQAPGPAGAKWVARPGQEPREFPPFVPQEGVRYHFPPGTFFRWQAADGSWQYGEQPQPGVRNIPVVTNPAQNLLPAERGADNGR